MPTSANLKAIRSLLVAASVAAMAISAVPASAQNSERQQISIEAQSLSSALVEAGRRYGITIFAPANLTRGKSASRVSGSLTAEQALARLLAGSGLTYERSRGGFVISRASGQTRKSRTSADLPAQKEPNVSEEIESDPIVVTGSRIERTAVNSPAPIDIVTQVEIERLGLNDTTEALRFTPALNQSQSISSQGTFNRVGPTLFGLASLDLRGLGPQRTLVLVNGRRHVGGVAGQATVDVSSIPDALIDRVEVLTGGGSSIYGADAVSGVVNYILKDDFEGIDYRGNLSLPTRGEGEAYFGAITVGGNFGEGRGNAVLSLEYKRQTELIAADRSASRITNSVVVNNPSVSAALGVNPDFLNVVVSDARSTIFSPGALINFQGSTFAPPGQAASGMTTIGGVPVSQIVDPITGEIRPTDFGGFLSGFNTVGGDGTVNPFQNPNTTTIPKLESYVVNALADYDIVDGLTAFVEAKYSRNESRTLAALGLNAFDIPVQQGNPFIPGLIQSQFDSLQAQNLDPNISVTRLFFDDVTEQFTTNVRETFRVVGGFEGEISPALAYQVSANYGRTDTSLATNEVLPDRLYAAADVIADPVTGAPICRSDIDQTTLPPTSFFPAVSAPGFRSFVPGDGTCAPLNAFAQLNALDPAVSDFIFQRTEIEFELEQVVLNATITGSTEEFFELPGGAISYAAGFEYRDERSIRRPDPLQIANLGFLSAFQDDVVTGGSFDVYEGFAEVNVPILSDLPFAEQLNLDASVRVADYSTAGTATSFAVGGLWQPVEDLRIRASFNRAVRAPNLEELFEPQTIAPGQLNLGSDPCDPNSVSAGTSTRAANCALLVPDVNTFDPSPSYVPLSILVASGGNPDLQEETADTYSVGFAYTPSFAPGLSIVVDYYDISIDAAIAGGISDEIVVQNCADAPTIENPFCDAVDRNPATGVVEFVQSGTLNVSSLASRGIDYQVNYDFDLDEVIGNNSGRISVGVAGTYLIEREDELFDGFPESNNQLDGEIGFPRHFLNVSLAWQKGPWSLDYGFNYQSNQVFFNPFTGLGIEEIEAEPLTLDQPNSGDAFIHYIGGAYEFSEALRFSVRVNNLGDRDPFDLQAINQPIRPTSFLGRTVQFGIQGNF